MSAQGSQNRDISANEELLLTYEDPTRDSLPIQLAIGGALSAADCQCGARFCTGDLIRRLRARTLSASDTHFFTNTATEVNIRLRTVNKANAHWETTADRPDDPTDAYVLTFLNHHKLTAEAPPHTSLLYAIYRMLMFGRSRLAYYTKRRTGLVSLGNDDAGSDSDSSNE